MPHVVVGDAPVSFIHSVFELLVLGALVHTFVPFKVAELHFTVFNCDTGKVRCT